MLKHLTIHAILMHMSVQDVRLHMPIRIFGTASLECIAETREIIFILWCTLNYSNLDVSSYQMK